MKAQSVGEVSFLLRRLEPRLAWAAAACTAWAALVLAPQNPTPWALALYAAGIGFWSRSFPAHRQWLMAVRALLLLEGAFVLLVQGGSGGPAGPFFLGPVIVATAYSLALARPWAVAIATLAFAQFAAACWLVGVSDWRIALAEAGVLCALPMVGMLFGGALRELDTQVEQARRDRNSPLYNQQGFFTHGAQLFEECRRLKRPFSLVLLDGCALREACHGMGRMPSMKLYQRLAAELHAATPRNGIAARLDASEFALAMPGLSAERARALLRQHLGEPPRVALRSRGELVTVPLGMLVVEAGPGARSLEDLYDRMHGDVRERMGTSLPSALDDSSTQAGLLEDEAFIPRHALPTEPMELH
ncbi:MAG: diguanylate cyclase [Pseudomonadota bacterium]